MDTNSIVIYAICVIVIFIIGKFCLFPIKKIFKLIFNSILGGGLIFIINYLGAAFNFHIGLNLGTAIFTGIFGVPGVILLIVIQLFLS